MSKRSRRVSAAAARNSSSWAAPGRTRCAVSAVSVVDKAADFLVKRDLLRGRLAPLLRDYAEPQPTPIHAVYPHRRHLPAKTRVFVDFLAERFAGSPWAF